jgi:hypothetical protein
MRDSYLSKFGYLDQIHFQSHLILQMLTNLFGSFKFDQMQAHKFHIWLPFYVPCKLSKTRFIASCSFLGLAKYKNEQVGGN